MSNLRFCIGKKSWQFGLFDEINQFDSDLACGSDFIKISSIWGVKSMKLAKSDGALGGHTICSPT
jgi:hypothetical protein